MSWKRYSEVRCTCGMDVDKDAGILTSLYKSESPTPPMCTLGPLGCIYGEIKMVLPILVEFSAP